jgi:hypothetical protein
MFGSIFSAAFLMSQYFQFGLGYSPLSTGLRFLPWTGLLLQASGLAWIATHAAVGLDYGTLVLPLVTAGIGISMAIPATTTAAISAFG